MSDLNKDIDLTWMEDKVQEIKNHKFLYKFMCFITFRRKRKLNYKELYLIYYGIHRKKIGEQQAKKKSFDTILKIYKENNGKMPDGILEKK